MAEVQVTAAGGGFGSTARRDAWWVEIIPVIVLLGGFGVYALRAFEGKFYEWGLISAGLADLYVRLVASGATRDVRLF